MGKYLSFALILLLLSPTVIPSTIKAQDANRQTLGPIDGFSSGDGGTNVQILTPQNQSTVCNPSSWFFVLRQLWEVIVMIELEILV